MSDELMETTGQGSAALSPGRLAEIACLLEVTARKPGNVHRGADFGDLRFVDFLLSASAIATPLDRAADEGVGTAVLAAVEATHQIVSTNTNLGMILLLAPLAAVPSGTDLAVGVEGVLSATTVEDARKVYQAIRLALPGGLGRTADQDLAEEPTVTLREAMALAAERTGRQAVFRGFDEVLHEALPTLRTALADGQPLETAIISSYLDLLSRHPDSLIAKVRQGACPRGGPLGRGCDRGRLADHESRPAAVRSPRRPSPLRGEPAQPRNDGRPGHGGPLRRAPGRNHTVGRSHGPRQLRNHTGRARAAQRPKDEPAYCQTGKSESSWSRLIVPSWNAVPTRTAEAPLDLHSSRPVIPAIPPPTAISTSGRASWISENNSPVPVPWPVPTRESSRSSSRLTPRSMA